MSPGASDSLLKWYDRHRRRLPWRALPDETADPYRVWLSEIMLQQTTVATVGPYFMAFTDKWPTVNDLARAELDDVLHAWQGLGYYARARNLHKCAQAVADHHGGVFPDTEESLLTLPGVGPYTAAAIAAIAFDRPAAVVDGNVERVIARVYALDTPLPQAKPRIKELAAVLASDTRPGDYAQAIMDLGATVCTPRKPACALCPWRSMCAAFAAGTQELYPVKAPKKEKPVRRGVAFWIADDNGNILLRRRPEQGLLGGMMEVPSTPWREGEWPDDGRPAHLDDHQELPGVVRHTFTHFHLELKVIAAQADGDTEPEGVWCPIDRFADHALPTVMKKVVRHALAHTGRAV